MKVQKTVVVDKPLSAVFGYLSDFTTTTEWDPGTVVTVNRQGDGGQPSSPSRARSVCSPPC